MYDQGEELSASYASADLFAMPSESETLGFVVLEAMASQVPVVAVRAGGIPDIIHSDGRLQSNKLKSLLHKYIILETLSSSSSSRVVHSPSNGLKKNLFADNIDQSGAFQELLVVCPIQCKVLYHIA